MKCEVKDVASRLAMLEEGSTWQNKRNGQNIQEQAKRKNLQEFNESFEYLNVY